MDKCINNYSRKYLFHRIYRIYINQKLMGTRKNMEEDEILFIKDKNDSYYRVIVPDYIPHLYKGEDDGKTFFSLNINEKLEKEYPHIYQAIKEEEYYISDYEKAYYFFEIPDKNEEIIGFATLNIYDEETLTLNQIYVMPEYRGKGEFYKVLNYFMDLFDEATLNIKNPNKKIMELLEKVEYLVKLTERFYISKIPFVYDLIPFEEALQYTNKTYNNKKGKITSQIKTNLYDKELNTLISVASQNNKVFTGKEKGDVKRCSISIVRDEDQKQYKYLDKRIEDKWIKKGNYFKKVKKIVLNKLKEKGVI